MKKTLFLILLIFFIIFSSCKKENCKERQSAELKTATEQFQKELDNHNLTAEQIQALTERFKAQQQKILAECN